MSNEATVKELYAAYSRGDVEAVMAKLTDDVVWESEGPAVLLSSGIRHGKAETIGFFQGLASSYNDPKLTITEYVSSGDTVMTIGRFSATVKTTGRKWDTPIAHYWKFRDGLVAHYIGLANTAGAVEAMQTSAAAH